jgi:hypothetical protein
MARFDSLDVLLKRLGFAQALAPEKAVWRAQWLEVFAIPLIAIALAWLTQPGDPSLAAASFPWLWLAPILVALRYGVTPGLLASITILANWLLASQLGLVPNEFATGSFFGGGLMVLLCGEFSDVWRDRNQRMEETYLYVTERLSRLTKRHLLLNLSHDRLEQDMLARPGSLRDALARLRTIAIENSGDQAEMPGAAGLLQLLSQYVNIESAALYTLEPRGLDFALGTCVAHIGEPELLVADDELLLLALEKSSLAHITSQDVSLSAHTRQLVVAPLIAGNGEMMGVLAVTRIPFFSLNVENLQMMSVMLAYYADNIRVAPEVHALQQQLPSMPALYAQEFIRMLHMQKKVGISSHIVVMTYGGRRREEIPAEFLRVKRGLDLYWKTVIDGKPTIIVLMPFTSPSAKDGFLLRTEDWLKSRFGGTFESLDIELRVIDFAQEDPLAVLSDLMKASSA